MEEEDVGRCKGSKVDSFLWNLSNMSGLNKLRASEPVSHASHHVSHARQMLVPSPFSFLRLLAAFGYLARVFAILALLSISFCYLPSSFSSFVKVNCDLSGKNVPNA